MSELVSLSKKRCYVCESTKPLLDFGKNRARHDGLQGACKACRSRNLNGCKGGKGNVAAQRRRYRERYPEKHREAQRRYKDRHPDQHREWYSKNREEILSKAKEWREANPDKYLKAKIQSREWAKNNAARRKELVKSWKYRNPEKVTAYRVRRRMRENEQFVEFVDPTKVYERDKWRCQICWNTVSPEIKYPDPMSASLDHIFPLSKGGEHSYANTQLAHLICNQRKHARVGDFREK